MKIDEVIGEIKISTERTFCLNSPIFCLILDRIQISEEIPRTVTISLWKFGKECWKYISFLLQRQISLF